MGSSEDAADLRASEKVTLGQQKAREFLGDKVTKVMKERTKPGLFSDTVQEYVMGVCYSSYDRPGLDFRSRALMNIAMVIALNRGPELKAHINAAFVQGLTEEEICEACRHAMIYCGVPAGVHAMLLAAEVADQLREDGDIQ
ncbi:carboxymuconolactone decarboxylase [Fusarium tjaetaba]|uniref:Carboxymuconolactone decarboxylase n=1 Tax=Fusarium tjaetaba TaxID=1567544 RepID=A0A8H5QG28_9HYPO|nr:carboxymuconolactone decarboxylase [Fusarium tjaetaba]KAF5614114.1 carboxymuconolactone decarboxylase [Fusarium tjaetaba]